MSRPTRERKSTVRLEPEQPKEAKVFSYAGGSGIPLGDVSFFRVATDKLKSDDDTLQQLHSLCYGSVGKATTRKKQLRQFSGFPNAEDPETRKKLVTRVSGGKKWTVSVLKGCCGVLGVERGGTKDDLAERLVDYLLSPSEVKGVPAKAKKAKKTKKVKKDKKRKRSDDGPKKLSPYILFSQAQRDTIKKKNPDATFGEVAKLLGSAWKALSEQERQVWVTAAAAANGASEKKPKKSNKKQKTSEKEQEDAQEEDSDESDEEESDDDQEEEEEEDRDKDLFPDSDEEA